MPRIATGGQQLETGVRFPRGVYSRVVTCVAVVKAPAVQAAGFTPPLGNRLWLLSVKLWTVNSTPAVADWYDFWILQGQGTPAGYPEIRRWEDIMPVHWVGSPPLGLREYSNDRVFTWSMNRHFAYEAIRFGVAFNTGGVSPYIECYASFEISEG